jgi:trehalose 6-phosphate synthase
VTALEPVMQAADGAWVGWSGSAGPALDPFDADGMRLVPVGLSAEEVRDYYEGFANATLWPLYHDVIAPPEFHRHWWRVYQRVNERFTDAAAAQAAPGATVWVHDYQLQLVPAMLRAQRPDLRIGFFNHIPFPGYEIFAQLPWRREMVRGLLGADLIGFQRQSDVTNFLRACRRAAGLPTRGVTVRVPSSDVGGGAAREVRAAAFPISIDAQGLEELARREDVRARAAEIRATLGNPDVVLLGVDRLDYTKGILHRLKAYGELLAEHRVGPPSAVLVQVASPSRERVEQYQQLRDEVEGTVGRINGEHGMLGHPAVHYLHQSQPREEMAALYLAADVMLVTSLRDGMNLVAKEYVACRYDHTGALVLSEFTGAADELGTAFQINPHDIEGTKDAIVAAAHVAPRDARRRMRSMRRRVAERDVAAWASDFLKALGAAAR